MKIFCAPKACKSNIPVGALKVVLYGSAEKSGQGHAGAAVLQQIKRAKLNPATRAWDLLSLALSVIAADLAGHRSRSPDGWTRDFQLTVAVTDPKFWNQQARVVERALQFLTTDRWSLAFVGDGLAPAPPKPAVQPTEDSVVLLSGGLDSLVGAIDRVALGVRPYAVSQTVRGDAASQRDFAAALGSGLNHLQVNHNAEVPDPESPPSQRARSFIFLAYGALVATCLKKYHAGGKVPLYICENGFISINPPLTAGRVGSLSTRTTHPEFLTTVQKILNAAGLRVELVNPYQFKTKGEMLLECRDQKLLALHAMHSTSCGRFKQHGYRHCGRCLPCMVRRAAFLRWGKKDGTSYVYENLGKDDADHAKFDDVRSVAVAIQEVKEFGVSTWVGTALSTALLGDVSQLESVTERGLAELRHLLKKYGVK